MKIVLYGATGRAGSRILTELLARGHEVVAVVRNPDKLAPRDGLTVQKGDLSSVEGIVEAIGGAQAVVSAYGPPQDKPGLTLDAMRALMAGVEDSGVKRLIAVGGAGSLEVAPGVRLLDTPDFPPACSMWSPVTRRWVKSSRRTRSST